MKQEEINNMVNECIEGFNFEHVLNFYKMFGDVNDTNFYYLIPDEVATSIEWSGHPLTLDAIKKTATDLTETLFSDEYKELIPKLGEPDDLSSYNVMHGGFTIRATELNEDNEITGIELEWTPLCSEGYALEHS